MAIVVKRQGYLSGAVLAGRSSVFLPPERR
jgi:hypothetical protein